MDIIQGQKFWAIADYVYSPPWNNVDYNRLENTFSLDKLKDGDIVYTHTMYAKSLNSILQNCRNSIVVVSHNADESMDFVPSPCVRTWFSQNVDIRHNRVESIPIGIQNDRWFVTVNKIERIKYHFKQAYAPAETLYANHGIKTNPKERKSAYDAVRHLKSATLKSHGHPWNDLDQYLIDLRTHKFVLSPEGNGIDCHRTWEAMYMGCIPILKRCINAEFYTDMPICLVGEWTDITEEFLEKEYLRIMISANNKAMLDFEYWKNRIYEKAK